MAVVTICSDFGDHCKWSPPSVYGENDFPHLFAMKWWDQMPWSSFFECWVLSQLFHSPLSLCYCYSVAQLRLFATAGTAAHQASQSFIFSWSLCKLMSIESIMPSNQFILCHPFLLLSSIFPSISLFQWIGSSHQVAKGFQLQHQSFRWIFRVDFL